MREPALATHVSEPAHTIGRAKASDDMPVAERVEAMLTSQVQCVLATTAADLTPAQYLMAYAASPCRRSVFVATPLHARKARQMLQRPRVSLLWDDRTGNLADHGNGSLVVATGHAGVAPREGLVSASACFLARNPNMAQFVASDGVGIFEIQIDSFEVVEGHGKPEHWDPRTAMTPGGA